MSNRKRTFFASMVFTLVLWSMGAFAFAVPAKAASLVDGDLIKASGPAVYSYSKGERFVFPTEKTYKTWYSDFSGVKKITDAELADIAIGGNVVYRAGTRLAKITTSPKVYAVEPGGMLRELKSEAIAKALFGADWSKRVDDIPDAFFTNYKMGAVVDSEMHPAGSLIKYAGSSDVFYVSQSGSTVTKRKVASGDAFTANHFRDSYVVMTAIAYNDGAPITGAEAMLVDVSQKSATVTETPGSTPGTTPVSGSGLTVSLSASTPAAATVISDSSSGDGAQARVPFAAFDFKAGSDGKVMVNTLKFARGGIATDSDVVNFVLEDGDGNLVASYSSFSNKVLTFSKSSGLFSVNSGESKTLWLKADLIGGLSAGKELQFGLASADMVTTDGAKVAGAFPLWGNVMKTASVTDLGEFDITSFTTIPTTVDPSATSQELWRFTILSSNQNMLWKKVMMTMVGSIRTTDVADLYLEVDGAPITSKMVIASDNTVTFDFGASGYSLPLGQSKVVVLKGTVLGGSGRNFEFTIRDHRDLMIKDLGYNVYVKVSRSGTVNDTLSIIEGTSNTTVNSGSLTITRASDSPVNGVALGATNQVLAKFNIKGFGEPVRVESLSVATVISGTDNSGLDNGKLYLDGVQIGTTTDLDSDTVAESGSNDDDAGTGTTDDDTAFTGLGNTFTVNPGETKVLTIVADVKQDDGSAYTGGQTLSVSLNSGNADTTNATKLASLSSYTTNGAAGNSLTITSGNIVVTKNISMPDGNSGAPNGVIGASNVKIGSFIVTASSAEGARITSISIVDNVPTNTLADVFQNLRLMTPDGVQLGDIKGTLTATAATSYSFSVSPAIELAKSAQLVVNIFADVLSNVTDTVRGNLNGDTNGIIQVSSVTATGMSTSNSVGVSSVTIALQNVNIATTGTLNVALDASSPKAGQLVMGDSDQTLAVYKLTASSQETVNVERLVFDMNTWDFGAWANLKLYDQNGNQLGTTVSGLSNANSGTATAGATSRICLASNAESSTDDYYKGMIVRITDGTGEGQTAVITSYDATGGTCEKQANATFATAPDSTSVYVVGGQAVFTPSAFSVPANQSVKVTLKGTLNDYPSAISGISHTPVVAETTSAPDASRNMLRGKDSNTAITLTAASGSSLPISGNAQDVYRTKVIVGLELNSPKSTQIASSTQEVIRFNVSADANFDATLNSMVFSVNGTRTTGATAPEITGTNDAKLYNFTDLNNALATESYKSVSCTTATTTTCTVGTHGAFDGIPVGASILVEDSDAATSPAYATVSTVAQSGANDVLTFSSTALIDGTGARVRYIPLASSKLYFGAQTVLTADSSASSPTLTVTSGNGFSTGDVVTAVGFTTAGAMTAAKSCTLIGVAATTLTCSANFDLAISVGSLYSASAGPTNEALTAKTWGRPMVYTGRLNSNNGEEVSAGTTKTFTVKGDTTGLVTNETLKLELSAPADFNWDDQVSLGVTTITKNIPVTGGTMIY